MTSTALGIENWFDSMGVNGFAPEVSPGRPLHAKAGPDLAARVRKALGIESVDDVLGLRDSKMYAWFQRLDGRHTAAPFPAESARRFYDGGTTVYLTNIERFAEHERELNQVFDLPSDSARVELFCNRPSAVTRAHFDQVEAITLQLAGRKTWRIAPNSFAPHPYEPWATLDQVPPSIRTYAEGTPPAEMPEGATTYELEEGSALYVPRGYWHETFSDQDSFSVHVMITPPIRMDRVIATLKNELLRDQRWRQPVYRSELDADDLRELRAVVDRLDLRDIDRTPVEDLPVDPDARFVRAGQAAFGVDEVNGSTARVSITAYGSRRTRTANLELSSSVVPACRWVNALLTGTEFDVADLLREAPELTKSGAQHLLWTLEQTRLVRRAAH